MKSIKKYIIILLSLLLLAGCASPTAKTIDINDDSIPSIFSVIGEKTITYTDSSQKDGVRSTELTYKSGELSEEEIVEYTEYLLDKENYITTQEVSEVSATVTTWQIAKESKRNDNIILITFNYESRGEVIINYATGPGTLTRY
ncbi:MAG: hypothetical protein RR565_10795 [Erysipelothrix sp.]